MRRIAMVLAMMPGIAAAEWMRLDDAGIAEALKDRSVIYDSGARQSFFASGRTLYNAGQDSWGTWEPRGGRYCSQWPPALGWACYDLERDGEALRFVGDSGDITLGHYE